jgi:hypothetical protein
MRKSLINTVILTGALLINYLLIPVLVHYNTDRYLPALIILGIASIAGTVLCGKLRYWIIPDAVHILLLWAAVYFDVNGNPYGLGIFFGSSPQILVWELAAVTLYLTVVQAAAYGILCLIKAIRSSKKRTHTEKGDEIV